MPHKSQKFLIIVDANDDTHFKYTDFASGCDASHFPIKPGDKLSWIVFSAASPIGYRIDFAKNGSPFTDPTPIIVPGGGISLARTVAPNVFSGRFYSVTLADLRMDDPQVVPYDSLMLEKLGLTDPPPQKPITVSINGSKTTVNPDPAAFAAGTQVYWTYSGAEKFTIDFSPSGGRSPFLDPNVTPIFEINPDTTVETVRQLVGAESPKLPLHRSSDREKFS